MKININIDDIIVKCVSIKVKPEFLSLFTEATIRLGQKTREEAGCLRFDVLQSSDVSHHFFLYEAYASMDAIKIHKNKNYYNNWRNEAEPLMMEPRRTISHKIILSKDFTELVTLSDG